MLENMLLNHEVVTQSCRAFQSSYQAGFRHRHSFFQLLIRIIKTIVFETLVFLFTPKENSLRREIPLQAI
jgi:hypothetical protein